MPRENLIVALDVGTDKVATLVAVQDETGLKYVGKGVADNESGMIAGNVVNLEATSSAIRNSVAQAEKVSSKIIKSVYVSISGEQIRSTSGRGVVTIRGSEVAQVDIDNVISQAMTLNISGDREIVNVEIGEFVVDGRTGIRNPKGMACKKLEVEVLILTASMTMLRNLVKAVEDAKLQVAGLLVSGIASSWAVLEEDEKKLGVALVDIGGGSADIAIYSKGDPIFTASVPLGGRNITNDISRVLKIPPQEAEKIKCDKGDVNSENIPETEEVEVIEIGTNKSCKKKVRQLSAVLTPRVEEILIEVKKRLQESRKENMIQTNVVITGGTANLKNIEQLASEIFEQPVRIGRPNVDEKGTGFQDVLCSTSFSTAVGMVNYFASRDRVVFAKESESIISKIINYLKQLFIL